MTFPDSSPGMIALFSLAALPILAPHLFLPCVGGAGVRGAGYIQVTVGLGIA